MIIIWKISLCAQLMSAADRKLKQGGGCTCECVCGFATYKTYMCVCVYIVCSIYMQRIVAQICLSFKELQKCSIIPCIMITP